ncbi:MAG TPA: alkaline phosphatase PhoX [Caldimonas sp.]|nr:alkaline phosphatase PhoX [Caldimonas sp.]
MPVRFQRMSALTALALASGAASAGFDNFTPLPGSAPAGSLPEATPLQLSSPLFSQRTLDANTPGAGRRGDNWDMTTANETGANAGRYLFSPFETATAGVKRYDLATDTSLTIVAEGTQGFVSGDASRWAPWGGYLTAEESWGAGSTKGRLFELTNPTTTNGPATSDFVQRSILPRVAHEGLAFDASRNLYFVDELNGGSIYKYTSANPNATSGNAFFAAGQSFVMRVGDGSAFGATGAATWIPITTASGASLPGTTTIAGGNLDGRATAQLAPFKGTGYNRPEDLEIKTFANGKQQLYFAATDTHNVFSISLDDPVNATVKTFVDRTTIDLATGLAVGSTFTNPDNLAIDAKGNIYVVEDQPGGVADIWFAVDADGDGIAESMGRWASMTTVGAEPTGLYFDRFNPDIAYVNIQHADSDVDRIIQISAVPEPESYALLLSGFGVVGFVARRRRPR